MSKELTEIDEGSVPAWIKEKSVGAQLGNLDITDYKPPKLKLIAATSPEFSVEPDAKPGHFWLTGSALSLGQEVIGTPIILRKSVVIWHPIRGVSKAPLAVSSDGVNWDAGCANQAFEVQFEKNPNVYVWKTRRSVAESGLARFGSSRPEDPKSAPAASLTYTTLWAIKLPDGRVTVAAVTNSRSGIKPAKELFSMIDARGIDHYYQRYRICSVRVPRGTSDAYFSYRYFFSGLVQDSDEGEAYRTLYEKYRRSGFSVDMSDEAPVVKLRDDDDDIVMKRTGTGEFRPVRGNVDDDNIPF